jgi:PBP1b-binding outer membrane lipoprotein LpoB
MKKLITIVMLLLMAIFIFAGCRQAEDVSYNLSQEADNFNVVRQITVINGITGDTLFQMTGKMSIQPDEEQQQLEIIVEDGKEDYLKHFIGLSDNTVYVVEQVEAKDVENYRYVINFNPKMWIPVEGQVVD